VFWLNATDETTLKQFATMAGRILREHPSVVYIVYVTNAAQSRNLDESAGPSSDAITLLLTGLPCLGDVP